MAVFPQVRMFGGITSSGSLTVYGIATVWAKFYGGVPAPMIHICTPSSRFHFVALFFLEPLAAEAAIGALGT